MGAPTRYQASPGHRRQRRCALSRLPPAQPLDRRRARSCGDCATGRDRRSSGSAISVSSSTTSWCSAATSSCPGCTYRRGRARRSSTSCTGTAASATSTSRSGSASTDCCSTPTGCSASPSADDEITAHAVIVATGGFGAEPRQARPALSLGGRDRVDLVHRRRRGQRRRDRPGSPGRRAAGRPRSGAAPPRRRLRSRVRGIPARLAGHGRPHGAPVHRRDRAVRPPRLRRTRQGRLGLRRVRPRRPARHRRRLLDQGHTRPRRATQQTLESRRRRDDARRRSGAACRLAGRAGRRARAPGGIVGRDRSTATTPASPMGSTISAPRIPR